MYVIVVVIIYLFSLKFGLMCNKRNPWRACGNYRGYRSQPCPYSQPHHSDRRAINKQAIYFPFSWVLRLFENGATWKLYRRNFNPHRPQSKVRLLHPVKVEYVPLKWYSLLLTENFPRLRKIQILLQVNDFTSEATPILWKAMKPIRGPKALLWRAFSKSRKCLVVPAVVLKGLLLTDYFYWNLAKRSFVTFHEFEKCVPW